jgi:hypothetical protein
MLICLCDIIDTEQQDPITLYSNGVSGKEEWMYIVIIVPIKDVLIPIQNGITSMLRCVLYHL